MQNILLYFRADDIQTSGLVVTSPDPTSGVFTADTATETTVSLTYTVLGSGGTPESVVLYFVGDGGTPKSTEVITAGTDAPDGTTAITTDGTYTGLTASLTIDDANCLLYTQLCASIKYATGNADDESSNDELCIPFGTEADKAGTKNCPGKRHRVRKRYSQREREREKER